MVFAVKFCANNQKYLWLQIYEIIISISKKNAQENYQVNHRSHRKFYQLKIIAINRHTVMQSKVVSTCKRKTPLDRKLTEVNFDGKPETRILCQEQYLHKESYSLINILSGNNT